MSNQAITERIDIKTGWNCNNRCLFCVQGNKRAVYGNKDTAEVKKLLEEGIRDADSIVFTGGEVTIRPDLMEIVSYARELGYKSIQIQTNGRMLAYKKVCSDLISAGATEFSPALHGHSSDLHDYLVHAPGAFKQTVRAIANLKELGALVITNSVICRANYRHLPELAALLTSLGADQFQFAFVHPLGTAAELFTSIVPRMSLIEPFVHKGLDIGLNAGRSVMTEAIPYCFMKGYEPYIGERVVPHTKIMEGHVTIQDYTVHRLTEGKAKGPRCAECAFCGMCEGPWHEYSDKYGWEEFVPRMDFTGAHPDTFRGVKP